MTCVLLGQSATAQAAAEPRAEHRRLKQLSLDDLMNVQVTSVAKEPQKLLQAAAAIQVITAEDIRRSGATSIPEALRLADNLEVAQINAHDWAISARGFNANLANKLLVLIDGRAVYTPLYGGVLWNVQDYLLQDIDRIEVISGPGGTLWGANAVNGVINIVTKSASATQGLYASGGGGNELREQEALRYGTQVGDTAVRFYGKYTDFGDEALANGTNAQDGWHMARGGFRMDTQATSQDLLTLQGDLYNGTENARRHRRGRAVGRQRARPLDAHGRERRLDEPAGLLRPYLPAGSRGGKSACAAVLHRLSGGIAHRQPRHGRCRLPVPLWLGCKAKHHLGLRVSRHARGGLRSLAGSIHAAGPRPGALQRLPAG